MGNERWRRRAAAATLVLACLLVAAAHLGLWARQVLLDTGGFVDAMAVLSDDDEVTNALAAAITADVVEALEGDGSAAVALTPDQRAWLEEAGRLFRSGLQDALTDAFRSDGFDELWAAGLTEAHRRYLDDDSGEATVALRLSEALATADAALEAQGVDLFDDEAIAELSRVVVLESERLARARAADGLLDVAGPVLPLAALVAGGAAVALARDRWLMVLAGGLGVAAAVAVARGLVLLARRDEVAEARHDDRLVVGASWDALSAPLGRQATLLVAVAVVLVVVGAVGGRVTASRGGPGREDAAR